MRRFGVIPYITPLQRATESSRTPKSVMKTIVGGGCGAAVWAGRLAVKSSRTNQRLSARGDFRAWLADMTIDSNALRDY